MASVPTHSTALSAAKADRAEILACVERISSSPGFVRAERLRRFLRHVVEKRIAGEVEGLKEYSIGTAVFDREADYDPRIDPIVRVEATRLRAKLREYYEGEGRDEPIRIQFEKGSYAPVITKADVVRAPAAADLSVREMPGNPASVPRRRVWRWLAAAAAVGLFGWNIALQRQLQPLQSQADAIEQRARTFEPLWRAFLNPDTVNYAVIGSPMFFTDEESRYFHRDVYVNKSASLHANAGFQAMERKFGPLRGPRFDYTGLGDTLALQSVTAFLAGFGVAVKAVPAHLSTWETIRNGNIIFIGPNRFNPLISRLPVLPDFEPDEKYGCVNLRPRSGEPSYYPSARGGMYAVISCFPGLMEGRDILIISSHSSPGTLGAAEYLMLPDTVAQLTRRIGTVRPHAPLSVLLRVYVDRDVPVKAEYVTHHLGTGGSR